MKTTKQTGPKTNQGKEAASKNSTKHGLTSTKLFVLSNESPELFHRLLDELVANFQPTTTIEMDLVTEMAGARWRLRRLWGIETGIFDLAMHEESAEITAPTVDHAEVIRHGLAFEKLANGSKSLSLAIRYEGRIRRSFAQALANLLAIQKNRRQSQSEPPATAQTKSQASTTLNPPIESSAPSAAPKKPQDVARPLTQPGDLPMHNRHRNHDYNAPDSDNRPWSDTMQNRNRPI